MISGEAEGGRVVQSGIGLFIRVRGSSGKGIQPSGASVGDFTHDKWCPLLIHIWVSSISQHRDWHINALWKQVLDE